MATVFSGMTLQHHAAEFFPTSVSLLYRYAIFMFHRVHYKGAL